MKQWCLRLASHPAPESVSAIADAIRWAEEIMVEIESAVTDVEHGDRIDSRWTLN